LWYEFCKVITSAWSKEEFPKQWKESTAVSIYHKKEVKVTVIIIAVYYCYQIHIRHPISFSQA
jgi:hypothetical protein